ncbi:MAG TPA: YSC84-related protein, partial [Gammaproteobacteria bacterium]|nr:YSC84-related protein [Gammaproteobacteria bacterium]
DPSLKRFIDNSYGYAVFPTVSSGAFIVGGSYGEGAAFHGSQMVAKCSISKGSIGAQVGGQAYSEVIFFQSKPYFDNFVNGNFTFSAEISAVALTAGAAANVAYNNGVAVFVLPKGGLMASAAVGGQKFSCQPASQ